MTLTEFETLTVQSIEFTETLSLQGFVKMHVETKDGSKYMFNLPKKLYDLLKSQERPAHYTINGQSVERAA